ncbi:MULTISPECIES: dihydrodipicolinate synthase family protein [Acinetobacter]|jgi:4-hydroxy-tetrahydrodipicolinate synthase|uniref:Dihydrodipicolinate synthase family protein n=2 Tax=Acinetobacter haemolyticus TaxID=29430 RepID=A0A857IFR6_ACIHA|nr:MULTISPECIES: dihydrodipicolinate synthase family protein [Acinetobacter]MBP7900067.1 dihydrodipicolinate synthase family protein [Acinetobacter sp.]MBP8893425.1 dihydrodipicolinate synthase family protein [Saprospiraceae bacterium]MBP9623611.1 dihydrodipicolinate synthase family protein [Streptococcus sp.]ENW20431.1 dihydrodipicolinate synthase [Acinetobacter haemolyticus CIP 64.3 = MTCC 9819]ENW22200.1 dihydrodipicolinate synthase [Acinetobacter haemolyticus NIPH 261]
MKLEGIIAYPITPFKAENQEVDFDALTITLNALLEHQCDAIAPLGSAGESAYLSWQEWQQVAEKSIEVVNHRVPVILGISELTTTMAIQKAKKAEELGADVIMVMPISYWKLTDQEIYDYYQQIAAATKLPMMVYNNPATSGVDMSPELIAKMFQEIENICMVKDSTGDIQRMHKFHELTQGKLPFYNGCNPLALEAFCAGASGWCTVAPNLLGKLPNQLYQAAKNGDLALAQSLFYKQLPLLRFIVQGGLPKTIKAGLNELGFSVGDPRKPLQKANPSEVNQLKSLMKMAMAT